MPTLFTHVYMGPSLGVRESRFQAADSGRPGGNYSRTGSHALARGVTKQAPPAHPLESDQDAAMGSPPQLVDDKSSEARHADRDEGERPQDATSVQTDRPDQNRERT